LSYEYVKKLISALNRLNLKYIFTGAFALSYYGYPRSSSDIDIIVEPDKDKLLRLAKLLAREYDISESDVIKAVDECSHFAVFYRKRMFPYFDFKVACKIGEYDSLEDYEVVDYHGVLCRICSAEDLIVKKLEWGDLVDVRSILYRQRNKLNREKLLKLAKKRNVYELLQKLLEEFS